MFVDPGRDRRRVAARVNWIWFEKKKGEQIKNKRIEESSFRRKRKQSDIDISHFWFDFFRFRDAFMRE